MHTEFEIFADKFDFDHSDCEPVATLFGNRAMRVPRANLFVKSSPVSPEKFFKQRAVASWLQLNEIPATRLAAGFSEDAMVVCDRQVAVWEDAGRERGSDWWKSPQKARERHYSITEVLSRLHQLNARDISLPLWDPLARCLEKLNRIRSGEIDPAARELLTVRSIEQRNQLAGWRDKFTVAVHADAHADNFINGLIMCDFDTFAIGPAEADLAYSLMVDRRGGALTKGLAAFALGAYPKSLRVDKELLELCADIHETRMLCGLAELAPRHRVVEKEFYAALGSVVDRESPRIWKSPQQLAELIARDVLDLQLSGSQFSGGALI